jgi:hypothetical protein
MHECLLEVLIVESELDDTLSIQLNSLANARDEWQEIEVISTHFSVSRMIFSVSLGACDDVLLKILGDEKKFPLSRPESDDLLRILLTTHLWY